MRIEEIIGQRIKERREELGRTQESVAEAVGARLGRDWTRQAVSAAEKGRRAFTAAELAAIAHVLVTNIPQLLAPPPGVDRIELGEGVSMDFPWFMGTVLPAISTDLPREKLFHAAHQLVSHVQDLQRAARSIGEDVDRVNKEAAALAAKALGTAPAKSEEDQR